METSPPAKESPGYRYLRLADRLAALIAAGTLRPGRRLPGERDLAAEHGVSVGTVRRAAAVLRERGLLVTLPAKGTYITDKPRPGLAGPADDRRC